MKPGSKYAHLLWAVRKLSGGQVYVVTKGEEFTCEPSPFQGVIYDLAATAGNGWRATTTAIGNQVFYAFFKETDYMKPNLPACPVVKKARGES